jgi:hypothetical protein
MFKRIAATAAVPVNALALHPPAAQAKTGTPLAPSLALLALRSSGDLPCSWSRQASLCPYGLIG